MFCDKVPSEFRLLSSEANYAPSHDSNFGMSIPGGFEFCSNKSAFQKACGIANGNYRPVRFREMG